VLVEQGQVPPFYNDLHASLDEAWRLLLDAPANRHNPLHTPVVATLNAQGQPTQRVMVLRGVDRAARCFRFHTDWRSTKAQLLRQEEPLIPPFASVLGYHAHSKIQLRLEGTVQVHQEGALVDAAWESSKPNSRRCYLAELGSGTPSQSPTSGLNAHWEAHFPTLEQSEPGRAHFAILLFYATRLEWHYLAHQGHRRALFTWENVPHAGEGGQWQGTWLVP
jgi:pyridoxine/pyridoxamine 5'-phosphate oxidase